MTVEKKLLVFDWETKDPYIQRKMGAGFAFAINVSSSDFQPLGCAVRLHDGTTSYITDWKQLLQIVKEHDELLAHNAQYDLGILKYLIKLNPEFEGILDGKIVHDTVLLYKLYDNTLMSYSLDSLAKKYLKAPKGHSHLIDIVWNNDLYPYLKKELKEKAKCEKNGVPYIRQKPVDKKLLDFAYANLDLLQYVDMQSVARYAIMDVEQCYSLYLLVQDKIPENLKEIYGQISNICVDYRIRGVRIDIKKAKEYYDELEVVIEQKLHEIYKIAGKEFSLASTAQVADVFDILGIRYNKSPVTGKPNIDKKWMALAEHEICKKIVDCKEDMNLRNNYIKKLLDMQQYTAPNATDIGIVYPEFNVLQAVTGRFSMMNPNLQQQSPRVREFFLPHENENLFALDFSNQEGRLQIHYAKLLHCKDIEDVVQEFKIDAKFDLHKRVAALMFSKQESEITKKERTIAKTINLGLSYGMGIGKLALTLDVGLVQAKYLKDLFNEKCPYLMELSKKCATVLMKNKYIKTIEGRVSRIDKPEWQINPNTGEQKLNTFEYKALNKLIQGSALDQTVRVMIEAKKQGIPIMFPIHDEFLLSGTEEDALKLKKIMETSLQLEVPSFTEIAGPGTNWAGVSK